jgi:predicted P-loop ATPase
VSTWTASGLTVLRTLGPLATKKIAADPLTGEVVKTGYGNARFFTARAVPVEDIYDLSAKLSRLEPDTRAFVVRGEIAEGADTTRMRRLLYPDGNDLPTLVRRRRRWVMQDFDNVPCPDGLDPAVDPEAAVAYLVSLLPPEFAEATCHWQFGSSQGFKPGKISAHLWFWLEREIDDAELERWAKQQRSIGIDPAVFRPVQAHYTAAPVFEGVLDPLPRRSGLRKGTVDEVAMVLPEKIREQPHGVRGGPKPAVGFEGYLARIGTEDGFHGPIMSAIAAYVREHGADGTNVIALGQAIRDVILDADPGGRDEKEIERYASDAFLQAKIRWAIGQEKAVAPAGEGWQTDLICSIDQRGNRKVKNVVANAILVLRHDERWRWVLGFDDFAQRIAVRERPPYTDAAQPFEGRDWRDEDDIQTAAWLQTTYGLLVNPEVARQAVLAIARDHSFHPVREYLSRLSWDGAPRLDLMLSTYFGVVESAYSKAVSACWAMSAVARVFDPGCKADHVLILEGRQGSKKSTGLRTMGGSWFTDEIDAIGSKDAATQLQGVWLVELPELDAMSRSEVSRIKAFMSKSFDRFRPPYGKHAVRFERQCVFAGTVNHSDYLRDETGNRRFWPVRCSAVAAGGDIDVEGLRRDRDELWAEAVARYKSGETWWFESPDLIELATTEQDARYATDAWEAAIARFILATGWTTVADVLTSLGVETPKQGQSEQNRVARCLKRLGWRRGQRTVDGARVWGYVPAAPVEAGAPVGVAESGDKSSLYSSASSPPSPVSPLTPEKREKDRDRGSGGGVVGERGNSRNVESARCTGSTGATGAPASPEHPCVTCGVEVDADAMFCPACWSERQSQRAQPPLEVPS